MDLKINDFWSASDARKVAAAYNLYNPRVTLIDVGWKYEEGQQTDKLAVRIHLRNKPTGAALESVPEEEYIDKEKIPFKEVDLIEANYRLHNYWWPMPYAPVNERARRRDPLCGGLSVSNNRFYNYGTLGGIVTDKTTGEAMILSNWHVLVGSFYATRGQQIYQPGTGDGGGHPRDAVAALERDVMMEGIDAAVAKLNNARDWVNDQFELGSVKGCEPPSLGMRVVKSGRGSDVTYGMIDGVEGEYPIWYGGLRRKIKHVHRIVPHAGQGEVSRGGDSGSWWLNQATNRAVGLHFAGMDDPETALAMAMPQVLDALGVDIMMQDG